MCSFDPLFSDKHCVRKMVTHLENQPECSHQALATKAWARGQHGRSGQSRVYDQPKVIWKWSHDEATEFFMNIDNDRISHILSEADNMAEEELSSAIKDCMVQFAIKPFRSGHTSGGKKKPHQLTLSEAARSSRKACHKAKK